MGNPLGGSKVSEIRSYSRFRQEGRSGSDTFSKLYSRDNCIPRPGSKPRAKNGANLRSLLEHDKETYSKGSHAAPSRAAAIGKKMREMYDNAPEPVRAVGSKIGEATEKVRAWPHLRAFSRIVVILTATVLCFFSLVLTSGFRSVASEELLTSLSIQYEALKNFNPTGDAPVSDNPYNIGELAPYDPTLSASDGSALSASDSPAVLSLSSTDISFVSECDIPHADKGDQLRTALKAGFDSFAASGLDISLYCRIEAGTESLDAAAFGINGNKDIEYVVAPSRSQLDTVGCHTLRIRTGGKERNVLMIVEDTKAPAVVLKDVDIWLGDSVSPEQFVSSTDDVSPLVVKYSNGEPNLALPGQQLVYLEIADICGNTAPFTAARLNIAKDEEPPVISGAKDRVVVIGESVSYKSGVTAIDNRDGEVSIKVDSSAVDPTKTGSYQVIYTAVDKNGNVAEKTVTFKFGSQEELDIDIELESRVEKVAKKIFKPGMTDAEKARAIYDWCRNNIGYSGHADKGNWKKAAITGFKKRSGDCYTYFACSKALFEYCGIENIDVVKVRNSSSESRHYWSLVDVGTGYYHFDATPRVGGFNGFMRTDKQIKNYSSKNKNSHRFDASLYPATPTESFNG